jgi:hypothetical protein
MIFRIIRMSMKRKTWVPRSLPRAHRRSLQSTNKSYARAPNVDLRTPIHQNELGCRWDALIALTRFFPRHLLAEQLLFSGP